MKRLNSFEPSAISQQEIIDPRSKLRYQQIDDEFDKETFAKDKVYKNGHNDIVYRTKRTQAVRNEVRNGIIKSNEKKL